MASKVSANVVSVNSGIVLIIVRAVLSGGGAKQSGGGGAEMKLDIPILSAPSPYFYQRLPTTSSRSSAAVSCSMYSQLCFDEAVKNDLIVHLGDIITSETSTDNY